MKLFNVICFLFICLGSVYSQDIDERLLSKYSQDELISIMENSPEEYQMLKYALDNAMYVAPYTNVKGQTLETIAVDSDNLPSFAELNLDIKSVNQYYRIQGEDKVLVVKSTWVLNHEMDKK